MKKYISILLLLLLAFSISSCDLVTKLVDVAKDAVNETNSADASEVTEVKSETKAVFLGMPGNWSRDDELNEASCIGISNRTKEQYIIVINESKTDIADGFDVKQYFDVVKESLTGAITGATWNTETTTTLNGDPAMYAEVTGTVSNIKIAYYVKVVETSNSFNQILGWTLLSKVDDNRQVINTVMDSFREDE